MKKVFYIIITIFIAMLFTSCVREYTCECKISFSGQPGLPDPYTRDYSLSNTRKKAVKECEELSRTYSDGGITTTEECKLQ